MPKSRYEKDENKSRHAATTEGDCEKMGRKYGWELIQVERIPDQPIFKVDCVFEGDTEFPKSYYDTEES